MGLLRFNFLVLFFTLTNLCFGQTQEEILTLQSNLESKLFQLTTDQVQGNLSIQQYGQYNQVVSSGMTSLTIKQLGSQNNVDIQTQSSSDDGLTIEQHGDFNEVQSIGDNTILDNATIIQSGNFKSLLIINQPE